CHQLYLPGLQHGTLYSTTSEQAVTLLEAFLQALPCREKLMFHVEHTPIQVLSTLFRRSFQQPEAVRVDQLQGQGRSQFRKAAHLLPIHTDLVIGYLAARNPDGIGYPTALRDFTEDGAGLFAVTYDRLQAGAAEGTGPPKQVNGFQQAGHAAAIGATVEIDSGCRVSSPRRQAAHRDFTEDGAGLFAVTYDRLQAGAAEGTGQTKQVNGFQQAGLAAAIGAMDEIDAGRGV